jgi:sugar phosphate isomerase/epimerase
MLGVPPQPGVSLCGVDDPALPRGARALLEWASKAGFRAVAIDAAMPDTRPRDMDRSARRGLAATLRRLELSLAAIDLWIPPTHLADPAQSDRALAATRAALQAAAEIASLSAGRPIVSMTLPDDADALDEIEREATRVGAEVADHAWPVAGHARHAIRIGIDPATVLAAGADPVMACAGAGERLALARLSDLGGAGRVAPGEGRLDLDAYAGALGAAGSGAPLVLDLRGVRRQADAAGAVLAHRFGTPF